jgi:hypothetical protein
MIRSLNNACGLVAYYFAGFDSTGSPAFCQAAKPPNRAAPFSIPFVFKLATELADECSFGQEQYVTISLSFGNSFTWFRISPTGISLAPLM